VKWSGQSNVMGRIASLAGGLLEPLAKKNVQRLIDGLQKALS
jgi:carbon monoxide dehydrogenase subunit G